ncbi:UPF0575 protein C19orf67 homolog isoform X1 [Notolabrus celidotus]|uniref:UPF0575 protein C19orf67 homolog isoform X1 n=1 Tax=Notolabrus celidotus TaxID=1203425 RepID=UPI0014900BA2|nr:UPF0575 protein C19orf67 homolog isoform X1 [Notolabrus celidotus]
MIDIEVQVDVQLASDHQKYAGQQEDMCGEKESDCTESLHHPAQKEERDALLLLADVALLPHRGDDVPCSHDNEACCCLEVRNLERSLQSMQLQLQFLLSKADCFLNCLVNGQVDQTSKAPAEEVQRFLYTCQPYFNHVESTTRSTMSLHKHLPFDIYARLLDFSQQLCDRLEQLVLTIASYNLVCLDEANPDSVSHFCIGQSQLGQLRLTVFLYCKLTPYMSKVNTGLYKRMRWNVERLREDVMQLQQEAADDTSGEREDREQETVGDTEYYFLCCEDTPNPHNTAAREGHGVSDSDVVRMWSIGQWVQVNPDPSTQDIFDWILCDVPQGSYHRLLYFGSEEPLSCIATDHLHKLLKSHLDTGLI